MKKIVFLIFFLAFTVEIFAQQLINADNKRFHFGFTLGTSIFDFGITPSDVIIDGKVYKADVTSLVPGFTVGVISDVRLGNYFNLRLIPSLFLSDRTLSFSNDIDDEIAKISLKSTSITVPLYVKFNAARVKNYKPYVLLGGGAAFDLAHDKQKPILLRTADGFVEFGVGCTIYFTYFRFAPEIRFALGFNNLLTPLEERAETVEPDQQFFTNSLSKLTSRMFTIAFNFE